jgi:hypothetical protein
MRDVGAYLLNLLGSLRWHLRVRDAGAYLPHPEVRARRASLEGRT